MNNYYHALRAFLVRAKDLLLDLDLTRKLLLLLLVGFPSL